MQDIIYVLGKLPISEIPVVIVWLAVKLIRFFGVQIRFQENAVIVETVLEQK